MGLAASSAQVPPRAAAATSTPRWPDQSQPRPIQPETTAAAEGRAAPSPPEPPCGRIPQQAWTGFTAAVPDSRRAGQTVLPRAVGGDFLTLLLFRSAEQWSRPVDEDLLKRPG